VIPTLIAAGGLAAIAAIIVAALARPMEEEIGTGPRGLDAGALRPIATSPTTTATGAAGSSLLPDTCADVYSADMKRVLAQSSLEVNSAWTGLRNLPGGSADTELLTLLAGGDRIECYWLDEFGGEDSAMLTVIAETTKAKTDAAVARLTELGLTRREENGGVRYFFETRDDDGELHGESHFFREGLWFATQWYGVGQFGYTADMALTIFD
jgi:hypothetical protein